MIDYNVWLSGAHSSTGEAAEGGGEGEGERTECPEEREEGPGAQKSDGTCLPVCQPISLPVSLSICVLIIRSAGEYLYGKNMSHFI